MTTALYGLGIYGVDTYGPGPEDPAPVWEEVYGPDYPLTADDVPVLENGICRVRWVGEQAAFALDAWDADLADYVEQGRVTAWVVNPAGDRGLFNLLVRPMVLEWTPERAVIGAILSDGGADRCALYITLQRGWTGPRFEAYATWAAAGKPGVALRVVPMMAGNTVFGRSGGTGGTIVNGTDYGDFTGLEPWFYLQPQSPNLGLLGAVLQESAKVIGCFDSTAYGVSRRGVELLAPYGETPAGYLSVTLGIGPNGGAEATEAQNLGRTNLIDARAVPLLVER